MGSFKDVLTLVYTILGTLIALTTISPKGIKWLRDTERNYVLRRLREIFGDKWVDEELAEHQPKEEEATDATD